MRENSWGMRVTVRAMMLDPEVWSPPIAIAHRGSRLLWPENTMEAFSGAVDLGCRHLETDLHITADGQLVCIHDPTVDRTTDGSGEVASHTLEELAQLDAGFRHAGPEGYRYRGQGIRIPTLEEVATAFPGAALVLDLKVDGMEQPLARLLDRLDLYGRVIVGGFDDARIEALHRETEGRVAISTGPTLSRLWVIASRVGRGGGGEAQALQVPTRIRGVQVVDRRLVESAHAHGLQVHVWTVNDIEEMGGLLDIGVDGIITDRPDLLKDLLIERGEWTA